MRFFINNKVMTQEEKDLLVKELSTRLPYGIKVKHSYGFGKLESIGKEDDEYDLTFETNDDNYYTLGKNTKPYLRSISSMSDEEKLDIGHVLNSGFYINPDGDMCAEDGRSKVSLELIVSYVDWLNKHHFDYRGLIPMDLALPAPEDMYK